MGGGYHVKNNFFGVSFHRESLWDGFVGNVARSNRPTIDHFHCNGVEFSVEQNLMFGGEGGINEAGGGAAIDQRLGRYGAKDDRDGEAGDRVGDGGWNVTRWGTV